MKTKNLISAALLILFSAGLLGAQEKISVPQMTDIQKHQRCISMMNYMMIVGADYAKSQGKSVGDFAKYLGDQVKTTWDINSGFNGFIQGTLYNWESFRSATSPAIEILKQTDDYFQFKVPLEVKKFMGDKMFNISFQELMQVYDIAFGIIAKHLGVTYQQNVLDNGNWLEITITNK
jgi:hypothetical protein